MPETMQRQADDFVAWVDEMSRTPGRLKDTPFSFLHLRSRWARYARLLLDGAGQRDAARELGVSSACICRWRRRFEQALHERYPDLLEWARWQRARRYNEVSEQTRRQMEEAASFTREALDHSATAKTTQNERQGAFQTSEKLCP